MENFIDLKRVKNYRNNRFDANLIKSESLMYSNIERIEAIGYHHFEDFRYFVMSHNPNKIYGTLPKYLTRIMAETSIKHSMLVCSKKKIAIKLLNLLD